MVPDTLPELIALLDSFGFDYGHVRISVWRAILVIGVILAVLVVARLLSSGVRRIFRRATRLDPTQQLLGEKIVGVVVWTVCILFGIDILGIDLTALTVFSGAFGLAVGFGLQKTFGNLLAGIILLMDRSIKPGDVIAVNDGSGAPAVGQVNRIGMRAVSVTTRDKKEYLIPNENLMINQVENWSYSSREVRLKVPVSVDYGSDIVQVEQLLLQAAREVPRILKRPAPTVWVTSFGDNGIHFELQVWITDPEEGIGDVRSDVLKHLWRIFKENKVRVPFPQREITVKSAGADDAKGKGKSLP
jgi:small-conductance mechanosensitive channel